MVCCYLRKLAGTIVNSQAWIASQIYRKPSQKNDYPHHSEMMRSLKVFYLYICSQSTYLRNKKTA